MGGSAHHYLAVDTQLRQVLGWFGALVAPTSVYLTGADFRDGQLTAEAARKDLVALAETLLMLLRRFDPALLVRRRWLEDLAEEPAATQPAARASWHASSLARQQD